jgi:phage-related protein
MSKLEKVIEVHFFQSDSGRSYVREWLLELTSKDRRIIGEDLKTVEFGWPIGMPVAEKLETGLWAARSILPGKRYSRVIFTIYEKYMVLLHGFIKKTNQIEKNDLRIARERRKKFIDQKANRQPNNKMRP